jgi:hypothetical protein
MSYLNYTTHYAQNQDLLPFLKTSCRMGIMNSTTLDPYSQPDLNSEKVGKKTQETRFLSLQRNFCSTRV